MIGVGQMELRRYVCNNAQDRLPDLYVFALGKFLERQGSCESTDTRERANKTA